MSQGLFPRIIDRVRVEVRQFQNWREDTFPSADVPVLDGPAFLRRFGRPDWVWSRLEPEFGGDVCFFTPEDPRSLFTFVESVRPAVFVEIGTWKGGSTAVIQSLCPGSEVHTINYPDPQVVNNPLSKAEIGSAFTRRGLPVRLHWADSADLLKLGLPAADAVFVDGDHREEAALHDMRNSWRLLKPGGWMILHDFVQMNVRNRTPEQRWVVRAWRRFRRENPGEIAECLQLAGSWICFARKRT
jgi:predicted O-methyltransferase YrrM